MEEDQFYGGRDQFCQQYGIDCERCRDSNSENRIEEIIRANERLNIQLASFDIGNEIIKDYERYINALVFESFELGHF